MPSNILLANLIALRQQRDAGELTVEAYLSDVKVLLKRTDEQMAQDAEIARAYLMAANGDTVPAMDWLDQRLNALLKK